MRTSTKNCLIMSIGFGCALLTAACGGPRVLVVTGTLVGIEATPGIPEEGQSPAVTFGYRRAEAALVPLEKPASDNSNVVQQGTKNPPKDAASVLATFNLAHNWFGPAKIEQYIATGHAAKDLMKGGEFALTFIGYEQGQDPLADKLAKAYRGSLRDDQLAKTCWKAVEDWMKTHFPGLPPLDIVSKAFIEQRPKLFEDAQVKVACPEPSAHHP